MLAGHSLDDGRVKFRATVIGEVIGRPTHRPDDHFQLAPRVVASEHGYATQQLSEYDPHRPLRPSVNKAEARSRGTLPYRRQCRSEFYRLTPREHGTTGSGCCTPMDTKYCCSARQNTSHDLIEHK